MSQQTIDTILRFNTGHMDKIKANYLVAAYDIAKIITELEKMAASFEGNYLGMGSDAIAEGLPKVTEHLRLLKESCEKTADYVYHTWETMSERDKSLFK
jgi:hypothetical protein